MTTSQNKNVYSKTPTWLKSFILNDNSFVLFAGAALAFFGVAIIIGSFAQIQVLNLHEPIFNFPIRYLMFLFGIGALLIAILCLFTSRIFLSLWLIIWLTVNFLVYRIGLWTMGWNSSGFLLSTLGFSLTETDLILTSLLTFLFITSLSILWLKYRLVKAKESFKIFCPSCGGHIKFNLLNLGQKIPCPHCQRETTLRKNENLRMSCFFCKEHIEFPAHALGEKIPCPHCNMDITLKEQA
jgi:hypothetical protein